MLTMTDLFCGAGGSSTGALTAGVAVTMAANHWQLAIDTHAHNHPGADHDCADISQVDPRRYPPSDILWASPECTNHSTARGRRAHDAHPDLFGEVLPDAAAERSRATMWDVPRFAEHHRYAAVVVENVVEAANWAPFPAWLHAMDTLGYSHQIVWLNSMHAQGHGPPAPQSRDRLYVVFHRAGTPAPQVQPHPSARCGDCGTVTSVQAWKRPRRWGRYRAQYVWVCPRCATQVEPGWLPAAAAIDWTLPGQRIGDRARPLAVKTMARIEAGLRRHTVGALPLARHRWTTTTGSMKAGFHQPEALLVAVEDRDGNARSAGLPLRTLTTHDETALVVALRNHNTAKTTWEPFDTFAAGGQHHALVMRNNTARGDAGQMCTTVDEPLRTLTTTGHQSLIDWSHLIDDGNHLGQSATAPMPAQVAGKAAAQIQVQDCLFRMLEPHEIAAGMALPRHYRIMGNRRERVRQAGNAVTPPAARDLLAAIAGALQGSA